VEFAVVEDDLGVMILGKETCQGSQIRTELGLCPFGQVPGGEKTKRRRKRKREGERTKRKRYGRKGRNKRAPNCI
jgi:hypothetical protein